VPTDTVHAARSYALRIIAWSLALFGLSRLSWVATHVVLPATQLQAAAGSRLIGPASVPVDVTLACSGADALALTVAALIAYPVPWRTRAAGVAGGVVLVLALNIIRIGTLGRTAASVWFDTLHLYVWPSLLTLAIAGYVFTWMRLADGGRAAPESAELAETAMHPRRLQPSRRFVTLTCAFLLLYALAAPLYLESDAVLSLATAIAHTAAMILGVAGVTAHATSNELWTARGGFLVTQECVTTPLIPVYLAAVCAYVPTWRRGVAAALATLPIFFALGVARLLVVALPDVVSAPLFFVHAFYQLLLGAVIVLVAARWRHGSRSAGAYALAGIIVGVTFVQLLGPVYTRVITSPLGAALADPQGAIAFLPSFQIGLYLALWVAAFVAARWRRVLVGLAALGVTQVIGLLALHAFANVSGLTAHVRDVRGWAVAAPLLIFAAVVHVARPPR
jgi:exosortase/archaeosortase family protein